MVKATREPGSGRILIEIKNGPDVGFLHVMPATARQLLLALDTCLNVPDSERAPVKPAPPEWVRCGVCASHKRKGDACIVCLTPQVPDSEGARVRQPLDLEGAGPTPPEFA